MGFDISDLWSTDGEFDPARAATSAAAAAALYGSLNPESKIGEFIGSGSRQQPIGYTGGIPEYQIERSLLPNAFSTTTPTGEVRRPGSSGRRYFTDTTYTPTGNVMSPALAPTGASSQGIYNALPQEAIVGLLKNLFGSGVTAGATGGTTSPTTKYTDAQVADTVNTLASQYPNTQELYRQIAQRIADSGVPIEDAAEQLSRVVRIDGQEVTPQEIVDAYQSLGFAAGGLASLAPSRGYYLGGSTDGMADLIPATIEGGQEAALSDGEFVIPADVVSHLGNGNSDAGARALYSMMDRVRQARTGRKEQGRKINPNKFIPA